MALCPGQQGTCRQQKPTSADQVPAASFCICRRLSFSDNQANFVAAQQA